MGTYTDTYVEMLQEDLQHQYRRCFEVGNDLVQALRASEDKDLEISTMKNFLDSSEVTLSDALRTVSVRDIEIERLTFALKDKDNELAKEREKKTSLQSELRVRGERLRNLDGRWSDMTRVVNDLHIEIERLTFALKDKDNELESVRDEHRTQIDGLMGDLDEIRQLFHNSVTRILEKDEEIERLTRKNKKRIRAAELRRLLDGHTDVLEEYRTAILEVREAIDQNKETLSAAQREMLATLDRHDALISNAFGCIDNHSDSIYKQQQSIDALWSYIKGIAAHINTGGTPDGNQD